MQKQRSRHQNMGSDYNLSLHTPFLKVTRRNNFKKDIFQTLSASLDCCNTNMFFIYIETEIFVESDFRLSKPSSIKK